MRGKPKQQNQRDLFRPALVDFINTGHELVLLSDKIEWNYFDNELAKFYSEKEDHLCLLGLLLVA